MAEAKRVKEYPTAARTDSSDWSAAAFLVVSWMCVIVLQCSPGHPELEGACNAGCDALTRTARNQYVAVFLWFFLTDMKKPKNMHQMPKKRDYSQKVYNLLL